MNKKIEKVVRKLNEELSKLIPDFMGVYVYGSQVRDDCTPESDIDIVGLFNKINDDIETKLYKLISFLNYKENVFIDIHPMTKRELNRNYFFHDEVVNKGIFYEPIR
ncbi:MAG: nucleotidyltransferase domain-containing protein [bacterium]